jgi:hypothetical protein
MTKALGRCARKHTTVVEHRKDTIPAGVCARCDGEPLIEWALNTPTRETEGE